MYGLKYFFGRRSPHSVFAPNLTPPTHQAGFFIPATETVNAAEAKRLRSVCCRCGKTFERLVAISLGREHFATPAALRKAHTDRYRSIDHPEGGPRFPTVRP